MRGFWKLFGAVLLSLALAGTGMAAVRKAPALSGKTQTVAVKDERQAAALLSKALEKRFKAEAAAAKKAHGKLALLHEDSDTVQGQKCWCFSFGLNTEEKFTAEDHYAVAPDGKIYQLDIITGEYGPLKK